MFCLFVCYCLSHTRLSPMRSGIWCGAGECFGHSRLPGAQNSALYAVGAHCKLVERMDQKNEQHTPGRRTGRHRLGGADWQIVSPRGLVWDPSALSPSERWFISDDSSRTDPAPSTMPAILSSGSHVCPPAMRAGDSLVAQTKGPLLGLTRPAASPAEAPQMPPCTSWMLGRAWHRCPQDGTSGLRVAGSW